MAVRKRLPRSPIEKDPNRPLIERALAMGIPLQQVANRYGHSYTSVHRFRDRMPQQLKAAIIGATLRHGIDDLEKLRSDEAAGLLGNLAHQRARLLLMQDVCMEEAASTRSPGSPVSSIRTSKWSAAISASLPTSTSTATPAF
jgi:hypothetical protein